MPVWLLIGEDYFKNSCRGNKQRQTAESEVSGSNPRARFLLLEQKPVLYHEWSGMVIISTFSVPLSGKIVSDDGVFDLTVKQPQLFRKQ